MSVDQSGLGRRLAVCVMGPTASGKTGLAVDLVEQLPFEIVSVDSAMIYRGMDIGTAKPDAGILSRAPHRLIDILDPRDVYSAARFAQDALREMQDIHDQGRMPLLVGGTFLYFRALQRGLSELPPGDAGIRAMLEQEAAEFGWEKLHARLAALDPATADRVHPNDPQRIQRALEIIEITGRPLSEQQGSRKPMDSGWTFINIALVPENRERLRADIATRFRQMVEAGLLEEVRMLRDRGDLHADLPSMRAVGYRQAWNHLGAGGVGDGWIDLAVTATRQYAKRQLTWLRGENADIRIDPHQPGMLDRVSELLHSSRAVSPADI